MGLLKHWPLAIVTALWIGFSLFTFKDYGITFDENTEYTWGAEILRHYTQDTKFNNTIAPVYEGEEKHQRHTPVLSQYYRLYPALLNYVNVRHTYEFFHFLNMMFATLLIFAAYILLYKKYLQPLYAVLGPILIFLTPSFLGHIPANPKDMPFAVVYFLGLLAIYLSENVKNEYVKILFLGVVFGFVQSFRVIGFSIYIVYLLYLGYLHKSPRHLAHKALPLILTVIVACFVMAATWPYIGVNFVNNFSSIFHAAKAYEHWDKSYLYLGQFITPDTRPWHYLPVLLGLTTPLGILGLAVAGMFTVYKDQNSKIRILLVLGIAVNLGLYFVAKPTIYNGVRHFLFLLPMIATLGAVTLIELIKTKSKLSKIIVFGVLLNLGMVVMDMQALHPYEYIYFNEWTKNPEEAQKNFEYEYWGASYKEATEWLNLNSTDNEEVSVYTCANSFAVEYFLKQNIVRQPEAQGADYVICDTNRVGDYKEHYETVHTVTRNNVPLNHILTPRTDK